MNRRGFLQGVLGFAAGAALPKEVLEFLAKAEPLSDAQFTSIVGDINFTSADLALSLDDFSARLLQPAMLALSQAIDRDILTSLTNPKP